MRVHIPTFDWMCDIQHDKYSTITISGEPSHYSIDYFPKSRTSNWSGTNDIDILQSIDMMEFQSNVAMLLRAEMSLNKIAVPLIGKHIIDIGVASTRKAAEIPLIHVIKSVIDGINREVLNNDVSVIEVLIRYQSIKKPSRLSQSKPEDLLSISIYEQQQPGNNKTHIGGFSSVPIHVVTKVRPSLLDEYTQEVWHLFEEMLQEEVATALINDGMQISIGSTKHIEMIFTGKSVMSKDVDNMARAIYPVINHLGVSDNDVHSIRLVKQTCSKGKLPNTQIRIQ